MDSCLPKYNPRSSSQYLRQCASIPAIVKHRPCMRWQTTRVLVKAELSPASSNSKAKTGIFVTGGIVLAVSAGLLIMSAGGAAPLLGTVRNYLSSSVLARSGFFAAFSLIFASELGDKTFFIAALLAMRLGKWISLVGSVAALSFMTCISVGIGAAVKAVPTAVESSEAVGQWLGAVLLAYFGIKALRDAWKSPSGAGGDELEEAESSVQKAEKGGKVGRGRPWQALLEVASLIFIAEWGDRSMLATIALGAAQSPAGVAGGAILGHAAATLIAVLGGAVLADRISEKTVGYIGGVLFLLFSLATILGLF